MASTVFSEAIKHYYHTESLSGFIVGALGLLLVIIAVFYLRTALPHQYLKGFFMALLLGGIFFMIGGGISGYITNKNAISKYQSYESNSSQFMQVELNKVEQIHKSWKMIFISWLVPVVLGLLVLMFRGTWRGFGLGLLLIAVLGHIEEVISFQRNENYRNHVLNYHRSTTLIKKT